MAQGIIKPADFRLPKIYRKTILIYNPRFFFQFHSIVDGGKIRSFGPTKRFTFEIKGEKITVLGGMIGAPFAVMMLENAIDAGAEIIFSFGTAGWIGENTPPETEITIQKGVDHTGISQDYEVKATFHPIIPFPQSNQVKGIVSINSIYAFTEKIRRGLQETEVELMDMECVPLSVVARLRHCFFAPLFIVSDFIDEKGKWHNLYSSSEWGERVKEVLAGTFLDWIERK